MCVVINIWLAGCLEHVSSIAILFASFGNQIRIRASFKMHLNQNLEQKSKLT